MSGDKRTVSTDALETLGTIIDQNAGRDAIHVAVEPVQAGMQLQRGMHVSVHDGVAYAHPPYVGIVDPFLEETVEGGKYFWLLIYPRTITSLRHVWSHPAFDNSLDPVECTMPGNKEASERWLREFIDNADCPDYDTVIACALGEEHPKSDDYTYFRKGDGYLHFGGEDAHGEIPDEFWMHLEVVSNRRIPLGDRASYFSCSC